MLQAGHTTQTATLSLQLLCLRLDRYLAGNKVFVTKLRNVARVRGGAGEVDSWPAPSGGRAFKKHAFFLVICAGEQSRLEAINLTMLPRVRLLVSSSMHRGLSGNAATILPSFPT